MIVWLIVIFLVPIHECKTADLDKEYPGDVNVTKTDVYTFYLNDSAALEYVVRVHVFNLQSQKGYPILVVIKQQKHVLSFEVPVFVNQLINYSNVSHTLCPISIPPNGSTTLTIEISSLTSKSIPYTFRAEWIRNFDLKLNDERELQVYPAQPVLLRYQFKLDLESVAIRITSHDDICLTFSLHPLQCPMDSAITFGRERGPYQTVTNLGVITTNRLNYDDGFLILLRLEATDYLCKGIEKLIPAPKEFYSPVEPNRTKHVTISLQPTPNRWFYIFPIFGAVGFFSLFYLATILILCVYDHYEKKKKRLLLVSTDELHNVPIDASAPSDGQEQMIRSWHSDETDNHRLTRSTDTHSVTRSTDSECALSVPVHGSRSRDLYPASPGPSNRESTEVRPFHTELQGDEREAEFIGTAGASSEPKSSKHMRPGRSRRRFVPESTNAESSISQPVPPGHSMQDNGESSSELYSNRGSLMVPTNISHNTTMPTLSDLSQKPYTQLNRKYLLYFWFLIIISIFYGLPAVQLIMIYQKALVETGNEDLCYYNFECARPLGIFIAFNNIISNVGYVMLGLLFLALTARRDLLHRRAIKCDPQGVQNRGIPQHYGLYYSMGLALTMEGIMSACYHMCPSFSNFQFDTAFMYILAMLIMLKIYQTRHPDVNATAHSAYMVMAVVIFLGVTGVVYGSETFWIAFTIFFLLMSVVLTAEIYYMGHWNIDLCLPRRLYALIQSDGIHCLRPMYLERMILLLVANLINFALAGYGVVSRPRNFSSFLLTVFMVNMLMYAMFYIIMKLRNRERFLPLPLIYMAFAIVSWGVSFYFFFARVTSWEVTPAHSRALNKPCLILSFYDAHDIWHFTSAIAMFFSFLMLMNLDDDLTNRPRDQIPVF